MLTQYLSQNNLALSEALESIPIYFNYQKNVTISNPVDYPTLSSLVIDKYSGRIDHVEDIDGIKICLKEDNSWIMLRGSGTEKKIRVYVESSKEVEARKLLEEGIALIERATANK